MPTWISTLPKLTDGDGGCMVIACADGIWPSWMGAGLWALLRVLSLLSTEPAPHESMPTTAEDSTCKRKSFMVSSQIGVRLFLIARFVPEYCSWLRWSM